MSNFGFRKLLFFLSFIVLTACLKDNFKFKKLTNSFWEPDVAMPLVNSSLSLENILKISAANNNFSIGSDNFVTLIYRGNIFSVTAEEAINIPDPPAPLQASYSLSSSLAAAFNALPAGTIDTLPIVTNVLAFDLSPHSLDSMVLKGGILAFNLSFDLPVQATVNLSFPGIKKNGLPLTGTLNLIASSPGNPSTGSLSFDLSGAKVNLNSGPTEGIEMAQQIILTKSLGVNVTTANQINYQATYTQLKFSKLFGFFDFSQAQLAPYQDTVAITLFDNVFGNNAFQFTDPSIGVTITNSFGIPIVGEMQVFKTYAPLHNPTTVNVVFPFNPINIPAPTIAQIGQSASISYELNNQNSNVNPAMSISPRYLIYKLRNLPVPPQVNQYFVCDTSRFKVDLDLNLPLQGSVNRLVFQDTIPFEFQDVEELQELLIKAFVVNEFPLEARMQIYFADSLGYVRDSLMNSDQLIIRAAQPSTGSQTIAAQKITEVNYTFDRIRNLKRVKQIYVKAITSSTDASSGKDIRIYSTFKIDVKLSAKAKLKFKI
jgi:hypothetical protein